MVEYFGTQLGGLGFTLQVRLWGRRGGGAQGGGQLVEELRCGADAVHCQAVHLIATVTTPFWVPVPVHVWDTHSSPWLALDPQMAITCSVGRFLGGITLQLCPRREEQQLALTS